MFNYESISFYVGKFVLCFFKVNNNSKIMKNFSLRSRMGMDFMLPGSVMMSGFGLEG